MGRQQAIIYLSVRFSVALTFLVSVYLCHLLYVEPSVKRA